MFIGVFFCEAFLVADEVGTTRRPTTGLKCGLHQLTPTRARSIILPGADATVPPLEASSAERVVGTSMQKQVRGPVRKIKKIKSLDALGLARSLLHLTPRNP